MKYGRQIHAFMRRYFNEYDGPTKLAEACADELQIYEGIRYDIPEYIYEIALKYYDNGNN